MTDLSDITPEMEVGMFDSKKGYVKLGDGFHTPEAVLEAADEEAEGDILIVAELADVRDYELKGRM